MGRRILSQSERDEATRRLRRGGTVETAAEAVKAAPSTVKALKQGEVRHRDSATTDGKPVSARLTPAEIEFLSG